MTARVELELGLVGDGDRATSRQRSPAMQAYCTSLARFTSSVQSMELILRQDEAALLEDQEEREAAAAARRRAVERAQAAAADGHDHSAQVRENHGLADLPETASTLDVRGRLSRGAAPDPTDLGVALTALARRRDELRLAESEFEEWLETEDEHSMMLVRQVSMAVGGFGAVVMFLAGITLPAAASLALLLVCTVITVAAGLGVAVARRLPQICTGPSLARTPDSVPLAKLGGQIAGAAAGTFLAANILAGVL